MKETFRELAGDWRIWLLVVSIAVSVFGLSPNPWASGAVVKSVDEDSPFYNKLGEGAVIKSINGEPISGPGDLLKYGNYTGMLRIKSSGGIELVDIQNQSLGLEVEEVKKININFGMDLVGGTRVLLRPNLTAAEETNITKPNKTENITKNASHKIDETISILRTRLNVFGLKNMQIQEVRNVITRESYIEITAPGVDREAVTELINRKGEFEAYIPRSLEFGNSTETEFKVGKQSFVFSRKNGQIYRSNNRLQANETITLNNVTFEVWNLTSKSAVLGAKIYGADDIRYVHTVGQKSYIRKQNGGYKFRFQVLTTDESIEKFAAVTQNLERENAMVGDTRRENCYLSERIHYYIDKKEVTALNLPCSTQGEEFQPWITGFRETQEAANKEMRKLQSLMKSGELPVPLRTVKVESVTAAHGQEILRSALFAGIGALVAVAFVVFLRYRNRKIILPVLVTSFSEVLIILGAASLIGRTIDLPAMAGIIAAIGSSVDDQIVITSETIGEGAESKDTKFSVKRRVKRAFFIVFVAAATTIVAMMSLASIGVGSMRGFAIMTIIGVLAGVLITRPAYGRILEKIV